jgi:hypothetical protein
MDRDAAWLSQQLGVIEKALMRVRRIDPLRYAEMFKLHERLRRDAEVGDADAAVSRQRDTAEEGHVAARRSVARVG